MAAEQNKLDQAMIEEMKARAKGTFWEYLGCQLVSMGEKEVVISLKVQPHHLNPLGIVHGGVLSTMLDNAMGIAAKLCRGPEENLVTSNLNVHFVAPLKTGLIYAKAEVLHQSRKTVTVSGTVSDEHGQAGTIGTGSFRVI